MIRTRSQKGLPDGPLAPFASVKASLRQDLLAGAWPPGSLMPSEAELVRRFTVSRMTINRALREMQADGLIERVQGVGTFAAQPHKVASRLTIRDLQEEIESRGHRYDSMVHLVASEPANPEVADRLGVAPQTQVFHTIIVHFENGAALQCEDRFVNPACAPDYLAQDFTRITPTRYLLSVAPYADAQYSIEAGWPTAQEARLLAIDAHDPCLIIVRRTSRGDAAAQRGSQGITQARLVHPGHRYILQGHF